MNDGGRRGDDIPRKCRGLPAHLEGGQIPAQGLPLLAEEAPPEDVGPLLPSGADEAIISSGEPALDGLKRDGLHPLVEVRQAQPSSRGRLYGEGEAPVRGLYSPRYCVLDYEPPPVGQYAPVYVDLQGRGVVVVYLVSGERHWRRRPPGRQLPHQDVGAHASIGELQGAGEPAVVVALNVEGV